MGKDETHLVSEGGADMASEFEGVCGLASEMDGEDGRHLERVVLEWAKGESLDDEPLR